MSVKLAFNQRCDRLRKKMLNSNRDVGSRDDRPFINRSTKMTLGTYQDELASLTAMAKSPDELKRIAELNELYESLSMSGLIKLL